MDLASRILKVTTFPTVTLPNPDIREQCVRTRKVKKNTAIKLRWVNRYTGEATVRTIFTYNPEVTA